VSDVPELRTPRLVLRGWREGDRAPFAALNADPEVMAWYPAPLTREQSDAFVERIEAVWAQHGYGLWALEHREGAAGPVGLAGYVGLMPVLGLPVVGEVEIGWRLARGHWGHGDATEGAQAVLGWAFEVLGLSEVVSFTSASNQRSRAVMERLGMVRDASADFDHPRVPQSSPLRRHVLYRLPRPLPPPGSPARPSRVDLGEVVAS
jgi:RimJ/RimL family protein N-acetyltransferase